jgi:uncharacterized protein YbjQ (UPF0145 family)
LAVSPPDHFIASISLLHKICNKSRRRPLKAALRARGANAVLAMRFDVTEAGGNGTEICGYCAAGA